MPRVCCTSRTKDAQRLVRLNKPRVPLPHSPYSFPVFHKLNSSSPDPRLDPHHHEREIERGKGFISCVNGFSFGQNEKRGNRFYWGTHVFYSKQSRSEKLWLGWLLYFAFFCFFYSLFEGFFSLFLRTEPFLAKMLLMKMRTRVDFASGRFA